MNRLFDIPAQQRPLGRHLRQLFLIHTVCAPQVDGCGTEYHRDRVRGRSVTELELMAPAKQGNDSLP